MKLQEMTKLPAVSMETPLLQALQELAAKRRKAHEKMVMRDVGVIVLVLLIIVRASNEKYPRLVV